MRLWYMRGNVEAFGQKAEQRRERFEVGLHGRRGLGKENMLWLFCVAGKDKGANVLAFLSGLVR